MLCQQATRIPNVKKESAVKNLFRRGIFVKRVRIPSATTGSVKMSGALFRNPSVARYTNSTSDAYTLAARLGADDIVELLEANVR